MDAKKGNSIDSQVGAQIKAHRERRGVRAEDLAASVGIPDCAMARFERGAARVPASVLQAISEVLGDPAARFFHNDAPMRMTTQPCAVA